MRERVCVCVRERESVCVREMLSLRGRERERERDPVTDLGQRKRIMHLDNLNPKP